MRLHQRAAAAAAIMLLAGVALFFARDSRQPFIFPKDQIVLLSTESLGDGSLP